MEDVLFHSVAQHWQHGECTVSWRSYKPQAKLCATLRATVFSFPFVREDLTKWICMILTSHYPLIY